MLSQMVLTGMITKESLVWKPGMETWIEAGNVQEIKSIFLGTSPIKNGMPPIPPTN